MAYSATRHKTISAWRWDIHGTLRWSTVLPAFGFLVLFAWQKSLAQEISQPEADWRATAEECYAAGDMPGALEALNKGVEEAPSDPELLRFRSKVFAALDEDHRSWLDLYAADRIEPLLPNYYDGSPLASPDGNLVSLRFFRLGQIHFTDGEYAEAVQCYSRAVFHTPTYAWAYALRGEVHANNGEYAAALADFGRAMRIDPDFAWPYLCRGYFLHYWSGDYEEAIADLDRAVALAPGYAAAYACRAEIRNDMQDYEAALKDYGEAIALDRQLDWAYANRGYHTKFLGIGDNQGALEDLNAAIEMNPENDDWLDFRADVHQYLGNYDAALADIEQSLAINAEDIWSLTLRGFIHVKLGQTDAALADFDQCIAQAPYYGWPYAERAAVRLRHGNILGGLADLSMAEELDGFVMTDVRPSVALWAGILFLAGILLVVVLSILLSVLLVNRDKKRKRRAGVPSMLPGA